MVKNSINCKLGHNQQAIVQPVGEKQHGGNKQSAIYDQEHTNPHNIKQSINEDKDIRDSAKPPTSTDKAQRSENLSIIYSILFQFILFILEIQTQAFSHVYTCSKQADPWSESRR